MWCTLCSWLCLSTLAVWLALPASAETIDGNRIVVIDGDTVALPCTKPEPGCAERVRLVDIDAPATGEARNARTAKSPAVFQAGLSGR
jgi:hypothetical protein